MNVIKKIWICVCVVTLAPLMSGEGNAITVSEAIFGTWEVYDGHWADSQIWFLHVGTLDIADTSYHFTSDSNTVISPQMSERFSFINKPVGELIFKYHSEIEPDQNVVNQTELATCRFNQDEEFLIIFDFQEQKLYFHSLKSEIQLYQISKIITKENDGLEETNGDG